ncbi:hypothetical protein DSECCO2_359940 [anaerobic digester metagenome]
MVHTQTQREEIFKADLEDITKYLAKRFKLDITDIHHRIMMNNELVILADEKRVQKMLGAGEIDELRLFDEKLWDKLKMFTIRHFRIHKGRIIAVIDYKCNVEIVTTEPPIKTTTS